jgi:hypothetical protein
MNKEGEDRGSSQGGATNASTSTGVIMFTASGEDNPNIVIQNDLGENDVMLGRGAGPNEHQGNVRFRETIKDLLKEMNCNKDHCGADHRSKLARRIVAIVKTRKGRFLRQLTRTEVRQVLKRIKAVLKREKGGSINTSAAAALANQGMYEVVPEKAAIIKARQALRFQFGKHLGPVAKKVSFEERGSA